MSDGESLVGDYSLISCVATGNTTQIWEAQHAGTGQAVALKLLLPDALKDLEAKKTLRTEAGFGKKFEHPNLVKVFDLAINKQHGYFSMEYLRAPNLKSMLRNDKPGVHGIVKDLFLAVAAGLEHMHECKLLHRDIKPDNILANKTGDFRLIDYSLAGPPDSSLSAMLKGEKGRKIMGTRTYIAPEMIRRKPISFATDIYSYGVTLYEAVTGHPPFMAGDPNQLLIKHVRDKAPDPKDDTPNLTDEANDFIMKLLVKDPKARPQTMQELQQELRGIEFWKEAPAAFFEAKKAKEVEDNAQGVKALDSRADAAKEDRVISTKGGGPAPKPAPAQPAPKPAPPAQQPPMPQQPVAQVPPAPAHPQTAPGYPPGQVPPGYPQQPQYGQPLPGQPYPGQPMPGQPVMPGQPMPGYPNPGQPAMAPPGQFPPGQMPPGYPQQVAPGAMPPGQQMPPQPAQPIPVPPQPTAPQPTAPQPTAPQQTAPAQPAPPQPAAPAAPQENKDVKELDLMTDLPDVL